MTNSTRMEISDAIRPDSRINVDYKVKSELDTLEESENEMDLRISNGNQNQNMNNFNGSTRKGISIEIEFEASDEKDLCVAFIMHYTKNLIMKQIALKAIDGVLWLDR